MSLSKKQQKIRRGGIGSSEVGIVAGLGSFSRTPLDVWRAKVEGVETIDEAAAPWLARGRYLEPAILKWWASESGRKLRKTPGTIIGEGGYALAVATPDAMTDEGNGLACVEAKSAGIYRREEFGEAGSDDVPLSYVAQAQWLMLVTDVQRVYMPVLIGGDELRTFQIERDDELIRTLYEAASMFWDRHVVTKLAPPVDYGHASTAQWIGSRFPRERTREALRDPAGDEAGLIEALRQAEESKKRAAGECDALANRLKEAIGDGAGIVGDFGKLTWLRNADSTLTDWRAAFEALSEHGPRDVAEACKVRHTSTKPGARVFRKVWK